MYVNVEGDEDWEEGGGGTAYKERTCRKRCTTSRRRRALKNSFGRGLTSILMFSEGFYDFIIDSLFLQVILQRWQERRRSES